MTNDKKNLPDIKRLGLKIYCKLFILIHNAGCHQRADRSFFYKGYQFPMCARCLGVYIGYILAVPISCIHLFDYGTCSILCAIMFLDWYIQYKQIRQSTNLRRLITGVLGGFGFMTLFILFIKFFLIKICKLF